MEALVADITMIHSNCVLYNVENAPIVASARELVDTLLNVINGGDDAIHNDIHNTNVSEHSQSEKVSLVHALNNVESNHEKTGLSFRLRGHALPQRSDDSSLEVNSNYIMNTNDTTTENVFSATDVKSRVRKRNDKSANEDDSCCDHSNSEDSIEVEYDSTYNSDSDNNSNDYNKSSHYSRKIMPVHKKNKIEPLSCRTRRKQSSNINYDSSSADDNSLSVDNNSRQFNAKNNKQRNKLSKSRNKSLAKKRFKTNSKEFVSECVSDKRLAVDDIYDSVLWPSYYQIVEEDSWELFASPVTEDIAPGYFKIITRPTDLSTIR